MTYFNIKTSEGVETIDEINPKDFTTFKAFRIERKRLLNEYRIASSFYSGLYYSQRATNKWKA
jgi:hypothetical protein